MAVHVLRVGIREDMKTEMEKYVLGGVSVIGGFGFSRNDEKKYPLAVWIHQYKAMLQISLPHQTPYAQRHQHSSHICKWKTSLTQDQKPNLKPFLSLNLRKNYFQTLPYTHHPPIKEKLKQILQQIHTIRVKHRTYVPPYSATPQLLLPILTLLLLTINTDVSKLFFSRPLLSL